MGEEKTYRIENALLPMWTVRLEDVFLYRSERSAEKDGEEQKTYAN